MFSLLFGIVVIASIVSIATVVENTKKRNEPYVRMITKLNAYSKQVYKN